MGRFHEYAFPGESEAYRAARDELLAAEIELRRQVERVAAQRRALPEGGPIAEDYRFTSANGAVAMSELFVEPRNTLVIYSYMFSPGEAPCPMCTSMLDGLNGNAPQIMQRVNLAVVARAPVAELAVFAAGRSWHNLPLYSAGSSGYSRDYLGENAAGTQMPMLNIFSRHDGVIVHRYGTELMVVNAETGQDPRHVDPVWPLWNLLDFTPEGRGDWYPQVL